MAESNMGSYKVSIVADYKKFQEDMQKTVDIFYKNCEALEGISDACRKAVASQFEATSKMINTSIETIKTSINGLSDTLKTSTETMAQATNKVIEGESKGAKATEDATKKIVSEYAKRAQAKVKAATEIAEQGFINQETGEAYATSSENIGRAEGILNGRINAQKELNRLTEQYNRIMTNVQVAIRAQKQLSDTTLAKYQLQIEQITASISTLKSKLGNVFTEDFVPVEKLQNMFPAYEAMSQTIDEERTRASLHKEMIALLNQRVKSEQKLSDLKAKQAQDADKQRIKDEAKETKERTEALRAQLQAEQEIANLKAKQVRESEAKRIKEEEEARKANTAAIKAQIEARIKESAEIARQIKLITEQTIKEKEAAAKKFSSGLFSQLEEVGRAEQKYRELIQQFNNHVNANSLSPLQFEKMKAAIAEATEKLEAFRQAGRKLQVNPINILEGKTFEDFSKSLVPATNRLNFFADSLKSLKHHIAWMASATVMGATLAIPASTVSTLKDVERLMAGMKQVNHDVATSQTVLSATTRQLINISDQYAQKVDDIIKAAEHKRPIAA